MGIREKQILIRAVIKVNKILPFLTNDDTILDIGSGNGGVNYLLKNKGYRITALDIQDKSKFTEIRPFLFDGRNIPFEKKSFDVALLLTVLHHTDDPEQLLQEAQRIARKRLIIVEDIYQNVFQKYLTHFTDSLVNWEWKAHPHSNKTADEWETLFQHMNLKILSKKEFPFLIFFRQVIYILEK